jgi:hypothetical protein
LKTVTTASSQLALSALKEKFWKRDSGGRSPEVFATRLTNESFDDSSAAMGDLANHKQIGGTSFRVGDCFIWAEIQYLDSPTDYREYLWNSNPQPGNSPSQGLVMLDDLAPSWVVIAKWVAKALAVCLVPLTIVLVVRVLFD